MLRDATSRAMAIAMLLTGCSSSSVEPRPEQTRRAESPIINGELDTTRQAVMRYNMGGTCTATVFHVDGSDGYALTAGHCADEGLGTLEQGDDAATPVATYPVVAQAVHPGWPSKSAAFDFGVLHFTGASLATPVIPLLAPAQDNYDVGFPMDLVGYGQAGMGPQTLRQHVVNNLTAVRLTRFFFDQAQMGFCYGDSGGPGLTISGGDRVAAVIQAVTDECYGTGFAGRVSAVADTFIWPWVNGTPIQNQTCDQCYQAVQFGASACIDPVVACNDHLGCQNYVECLDACGDQDCIDGCETTFPLGAEVYAVIGECACNVCQLECTGDPRCVPEMTGTGGGGGTTASSTTAASSSSAGGGGMGGAADPERPDTGDDGSCSHGAGRSDGWWLVCLSLLGYRRRRTVVVPRRGRG